MKRHPIIFIALSLLAMAGLTNLQAADKITPQLELKRLLDAAGVKNARLGGEDTAGGICTVDLSGTDIADLTPLKGMPINSLILCGSKIVDLSPLHGMPLYSLCLVDTAAEDLRPLKDMPLKSLFISGSNITNLSPLLGMSLISLQLQKTKIVDITPLKGMPLQTLDLAQTSVKDLAPLKGMTLEYFFFSAQSATNGIDVVRRMTSIKFIGAPSAETPEDFWKKYDAGHFQDTDNDDRTKP